MRLLGWAAEASLAGTARRGHTACAHLTTAMKKGGKKHHLWPGAHLPQWRDGERVVQNQFVQQSGARLGDTQEEEGWRAIDLRIRGMLTRQHAAPPVC